MTVSTRVLAIAVGAGLLGCESSRTREQDRASTDTAGQQSAPAPTSSAAPASAKGKAVVSLTGEGVSVTGEYPARLCGDPYMMGDGMAYQVETGDWQITIASESRVSGDVQLNHGDGAVQVVASANGPNRQFVRKPADGGSLAVAEDFKRAEAKLDLRNVVGPEKAKLSVTFECS